MHNSDILQCLPLLADILGRSYGVSVEIGGSQAYTDGRTIHLPSLPITGEPDFINLVRGYIDHEAAHIRHTDFDAIAKEKPTKLEHHIWNSFEDWRVETALGALFPGCKSNFRWLIRTLFKGQSSSKFPLLDWLLISVRCWSEPALEKERDRLAGQLEAGNPGLVPKIEPILIAMQSHCPNSMACLDYACQIVALLKDEAQTMQTKYDRKQKPINQEGETSQQGNPLQDLLGAGEADLPDDIERILERKIVKEAQKSKTSPRIAIARIAPKPVLPMQEDEVREVRDVASGLGARLHGLLQSTRLVRRMKSRRGKLDCRRLYGIAVNDPKLFRAHQEKKDVNTAFHILLDSSGSMSSKIVLASQCCMAVAASLDQSGISVGMTAFPGGKGKSSPPNHPTVSPIIAHGERVQNRTGIVQVGGGTPLTESLWWVLQHLVPRKETRKIVLIVTDGIPEDPFSAAKTIEMAKGLGIEVYLLGVKSSRIEEQYPGISVNVAHLADLPKAVFGLVEKALLVA